MSQETLIREHIARLGCSSDFLCSLSGITPTKMSKAIRGLVSLTGPEVITVDSTLAELDALVKAFAPVPISLENPRIIGDLLEDIRNRNLTTAYSVKFGRNWFCSRTGGHVQSSFSMLMSTPMEHLVASKVAEALKPSWPDAEVIRNPFASVDSIASDFGEVWQ